jgi:hypothetical protein
VSGLKLDIYQHLHWLCNHFYLVSLPGVVIAIFLGRNLNRRMHAPQFISYVYVGLTAIGVVLLLQAIVGWSKMLR